MTAKTKKTVWEKLIPLSKEKVLARGYVLVKKKTKEFYKYDDSCECPFTLLRNLNGVGKGWKPVRVKVVEEKDEN